MIKANNMAIHVKILVYKSPIFSQYFARGNLAMPQKKQRIHSIFY
jgi:hypothetical protein